MCVRTDRREREIVYVYVSGKVRERELKGKMSSFFARIIFNEVPTLTYALVEEFFVNSFVHS